MNNSMMQQILRRVDAFIIVVRNMLLGGNLVSLSFIAKPRRMARYVTECLFLYKSMGFKRGIPEKQVYKALNSNNIEEITLGNLNVGTWIGISPSFSTDIIGICLICRILKPKRIFEIGTLRGYVAFHIALNTPDDAEIYTLDLPKDSSSDNGLQTTVMDERKKNIYRNSTEYVFKNSNVAHKITCLFGDSSTFDFTPFQENVDFFFIDGAHSYEYVKSDTLNALKCCRPGSVIAWHDFGRMGINGVSKWVLEFSKNHEIFCVPGGSLAYMIVKE